MPWPARITGRFDFASRSTADAISGCGTVSLGRYPRSFTGDGSHVQSIFACCASFVMSTSTGPGRPDLARTNASFIAGMMSSTRVTR
jgi:hypothetical protein